jgi:tetratricopeptide (TPR) repeat protein
LNAAARALIAAWLLAAAFAAAGADFAALSARAAAARDANRLDEALDLYRQALALKPDWAEGWWSVGTLLYDRDSYAEAAGALRKAVELSPGSGVALAMLGLCEAKLGRGGEAIEHLGAGLQRGVGDSVELRRVALYTEGRLLVERGDFGRAQETLALVARDGVESDELIEALGQAALGMKSLSAADAATVDIVRRAGEAEALSARGDFAAAARAWDSLCSQAPAFHNLQFAYGRFLLARQEDAKAIEAFRREIANTPKHLLARLGIAGICVTSDPAAGLPYAEEAVKLAPHLGEAHYLLGMLLLATDQTGRAIGELERARQESPAEAKTYFALSRAYTAAHRAGDAASARDAFRRLTAAAPR